MKKTRPTKKTTVPEKGKQEGGKPFVPSAKGRAMLSIIHQYGLIERWPPERILAAQFEKMGKLLAHASKTVHYYKTLLKDGGISDPAKLTPDEWETLPLLNRQAIQTAGTDLHSIFIPHGHGRVNDIYTSGTTGRPVRVLRTELSNLYWAATTLRDHLWHRRDFKGKLAVMRNSDK